MRRNLYLFILMGLLFPCSRTGAQCYADAGQDTVVYYGQKVRLGGNPTALGASDAYRYQWSPMHGLANLQAPDPLARPTHSTTYKVIIKGPDGCMDMDTVHVYVSELNIHNSITGLIRDSLHLATRKDSMEVLRMHRAPEVYFMVQIGAFQKADLDVFDALGSVGQIKHEVTENGITRFLLGKVYILDDAYTLRKLAYRQDIEEAFIVPYYRGKRIMMSEALRLLAKYGYETEPEIEEIVIYYPEEEQ